jgi:hypothetical protein
MTADLKISAAAGQTGGAGETADQVSEYLRKDGQYVSPFAVTAPLGAGSSTAASAPVIASIGAVNGTARQLADTSRDYEVYLTVGTAGTATTVTIGHTSAASDAAVSPSGPVTAGQVITFRLPAGWYLKWSGTTTTLAAQTAVGC